MRLFGTGILVAAGLVLAASADAQTKHKPAAPTGPIMTAAQIQAFLIGAKIESVAPNGSSRAIIQHTADGKSTYEIIRGDKKSHVNGIWKMRGNQFCRRMEQPKATDVCFDYRKVNDTTVAVYEGKKLAARQTRIP